MIHSKYKTLTIWTELSPSSCKLRPTYKNPFQTSNDPLTRILPDSTKTRDPRVTINGKLNLQTERIRNERRNSRVLHSAAGHRRANERGGRDVRFTKVSRNLLAQLTRTATMDDVLSLRRLRWNETGIFTM